MRQVADVFESAEKLGLKVIRMWAFNDGDGWNALQPRIGQIDDHVLRCCRTLHVGACNASPKAISAHNPQQVRFCD